MSVTIKLVGSGRELKHILANDSLEVEIRTGLDARVSVLRDRKSGRNLLSEKVFASSGRSKLPYGLTTWVKGGDRVDGFSGVVSLNQLGYEKVPVQEPQIKKGPDGVRLRTTQQGNGLRFEKHFFVPARGSRLTYETSVTNLGDAPRRLQIEHFFVWDQADDRTRLSYVWPTLNGPDALRLLAHEDLDCRTAIPAEPWAAVLDHAAGLGVIMTFEGLYKLQRYVSGPFSEFGGYGPAMMLAPGAGLSSSWTFHVAAPLAAASVDRSVADLRRRLVALIDMPRVSVSERLSFDDTLGSLLPAPKRVVRTHGEFTLKPSARIRANRCGHEAMLFARQLKVQHGFTLAQTTAANAKIELRTERVSDSPEAYRLDLTPDKVTVHGEPAGIQHGLATLLDLLQSADAGATAPCCTITDEPDLAFRGMMMFAGGRDWDLRLERFAAHVLARLKFNAFSFFLSPGGIRFDKPIPGVEVAENAIPESRLRALARSFRSMHIEPLPICPTSHIRCPNQKEELRVAFAMLERVADIFRPRWINICYDEMGHFSAKCDCCKDKPNHLIFIESIERFHQFLKEHGALAAIWNDMLFRSQGDPLGWLDDQQWAVDHLSKDVVLNDYEYDPATVDFARLGRWRLAGFKYVTGSPWSVEENVLHYAQSLLKYGSLGLLGTSWGDGPSVTGLGHIEGVVWASAYGWRIGVPPIRDAQIAVRRRVQQIMTRKWDQAGY